MSSAPEPPASSLLSALDRMQAVLRRLGAVQDLERLCAAAVQEAADCFGVTQSCLAFYDPQTGTMRFQQPAIGLDEAQLQALSAPPAPHIERLLRDAPDPGVMRLLAPQHRHLAVPNLISQLSERDVLIGLIRTEGQVIGELRLANKADGTAFTVEEVHLLGLFASQLGVLIRNWRLLANEQRARRLAETLLAELALVNQVSTALSASLDLPAVLQSTVTQLALALNVEQCGLVLLDRHQGVGRVVAEYQRQPDDTGKNVLIPIQGNLSLARILETKSPLAIRDAQHDPLLTNVHQIMAARGVKSILLLPLIVHGEVIGTVGLDELEEMRNFDPAEIALAQTITNQAATAVANARLFADVQRRVTQLQTIQAVTRRISSILDPTELLAQVSDLICERFGYYHVHVFLVDETSECLIARGGSGEAGRQIVAERLRLRSGEQGICGAVAGAAQAIIVNDVRADSRYQPHRLLANTRAEAAMPILLGSQVVGVLDVQSEQVNAFDETDRFVLATLADQIAIALENARLYQLEQERTRELTDAYEEVKALDRMKDEFVQTVSHELRTPLTFIKGYVELLLEGVMGAVGAEQREALQIIAQRTDGLVRLVGEIISMARADAVGLSLLPVSLAEIADGAVQSARAVAAQVGLVLATDFEVGLPPVQGNVQHLTQVFDNLIGNAVKFSPQGGTITVRLRTGTRFVRAEVSDQGFGIPTDQQDRIWERFYQVDNSKTRRFGGTGLGLAIVKRLVEAHGGQVGVHSVEGQGSTFFFTVPRADV